MAFTDTVFNWLPRYRKPDLTLSDAKCDASGNLLVTLASSTSAVTTWVDPAAGTPLTYRRQLATTAKKLHVLLAENTGAGARWLMVFDRTAAPTAGAEPVFAFSLAAGAGLMLDLRRPRAFVNGIWWGTSSTGGTYTEDTAALVRVNAEVE